MDYKNKADFQAQYSSGLSYADIAKICLVSISTIRKWAKKHGIVGRSISDSMKVKWTDATHRQKAIRGITIGLANSKEKRRISSQLMWADPIFRAAQLNKRRNQEYRTLQSEIQKARLQNDSAALIKAIEILARNRNDPQVREVTRRKLQQLWSNSEQKARLLAAMSSGRSTIEYQERLSKAMKSAMGTPEMRLAISRRTQKLWENPDYKAKVNAARRAKWAEEAYRTKLAQTQARRTTVSILEQLVVRLLAERGIEAGPTQLGPWTFDIHFELRGRGVLIECQGDYWHRQPATAIRDKQKTLTITVIWPKTTICPISMSLNFMVNRKSPQLWTEY